MADFGIILLMLALASLASIAAAKVVMALPAAVRALIGKGYSL